MMALFKKTVMVVLGSLVLWLLFQGWRSPDVLVDLLGIRGCGF